MHGFFIAGTDTEVGKTAITVGLLEAFLKSGLDVTAIDAPLPIYDWKGILGVVTPILVTTQFGQ